jgi:hypothetical protein
MFRITQGPSSGSIDSYLIKTKRNVSTVIVVCAVGVWRHIQDLWCVCARCSRQTPTAHTTSTVEPLRVVLINYESILPDDGSCVFLNMLE